MIPTLVILGALHAFVLLITLFFFWASIHVTHQAQYISETYRRRAGARVEPLDRLLDGGLILGSLYTMAMYKFVDDKFTLGDSTLLFPRFLQRREFAVAFTVGFAIFFVYYVVRTLGEIRRGEASWPRLLFMSLTVGLAFIIPIFDNLDIAFQGFNTWHSLQYLALTWFILGRSAAHDEIGSPIARKLAGHEKTGRYLRRHGGRDVLGRRRLPPGLEGSRVPAGQELLRGRAVVPALPLLLRPHPLPGLRAARGGEPARRPPERSERPCGRAPRRN